MKVNERVYKLEFVEEDSKVVVMYSNRGEPYRDGVEISFDSGYSGMSSRVLLDVREVTLLRDKLTEFLEPNNSR